MFEHWVFMFGRHPGRTKLDAERRAVIQAAVEQWGLAEIMLAVEGMAAAPLADKPGSMRDAMREITWFLAKARRVETCLRYGDELRAMVDRKPDASAAELPAEPVDAAAVAQRRQRLRELAQALSASHG